MSTRSLEQAARSTDPETSKWAAASITQDDLNELQAWVMVALRECPMADHELVQAAKKAVKRGELVQVTDQRIRTTRKYLERARFIEWNGGHHFTESDRLARVFQVVTL